MIQSLDEVADLKSIQKVRDEIALDAVRGLIFPVCTSTYLHGVVT